MEKIRGRADEQASAVTAAVSLHHHFEHNFGRIRVLMFLGGHRDELGTRMGECSESRSQSHASIDGGAPAAAHKRTHDTEGAAVASLLPFSPHVSMLFQRGGTRETLFAVAMGGVSACQRSSSPVGQGVTTATGDGDAAGARAGGPYHDRRARPPPCSEAQPKPSRRPKQPDNAPAAAARGGGRSECDGDGLGRSSGAVMREGRWRPNNG